MFRAMNTEFSLAGLPDSYCNEVKNFIRKTELLFSRFSLDSEISRLNRRTGEWVEVSPLTILLLEEALLAYQETFGLFNPFMGGILEQAGYNQSFDELGAVSGSLSPVVAPTVFERKDESPLLLEYTASGGKARLMPGVQFDAGGIAKGWSAQYLCHQLLLQGNEQGLINAGGDIILWGEEPIQKEWGVGIENPFAPDDNIGVLFVTGMTAIATSSVLKRKWQTIDGQQAHHIIDPRTNRPASSDLVQVTVLSRDLTIAERYTKCLLILGSEAGFSWLQEKSPSLGYIAVRKNGDILTSPNLSLYCSEMEVVKHANLVN